MSAVVRTVYLPFTQPNVLRLLAGAKTQTRRVMREQLPEWACGLPWSRDEHGDWYLTKPPQHWHHVPTFWTVKPPAQPGDLLGVQEDYQITAAEIGGPIDIPDHWFAITYLADGKTLRLPVTITEWNVWAHRRFPNATTPARFMYRSLVRLRYPILSVTPQWLQDMSEADARAEGCASRMEYRIRWDMIHWHRPERHWSANPAVWRWEFDTKGKTK